MTSLHKAVIAAETCATTLTSSLRTAFHHAGEQDPVLAIMLGDLIKLSSKVEHRLEEIVTLHKEQRAKPTSQP